MSYEGYDRFLCKNGHKWSLDAHETMYLDEDQYPKCPICGDKHVYINLVNVTNGSFDDDGERIDGYIELKPKEINYMVCPKCGRKHICSCSTYEIPNEEEDGC